MIWVSYIDDVFNVLKKWFDESTIQICNQIKYIHYLLEYFSILNN